MNRFLIKWREISSRILEVFKNIRGIEISGFKLYFSWSERSRLSISDLLTNLNNIAYELNTKFIIAFDEAQELSSIRGVRFDYILAYAYDNLRNLKFILTGSKVGLLYRFLKVEDPDAPLFGRPFWKIELTYFSKEESKLFLEKGFEEASIKYHRHEVEETIDRFNGVPGWLSYYGYLRLQGISHEEALKETTDKASLLLSNEFNNFLIHRPIARDRYIEIMRAISSGASRWGEIKKIVELRLNERIPPKTLRCY